MKTVIIEYATISPATLGNKLQEAFICLCNWKDIDGDCYEFTAIVRARDMNELEDVLAEYV